jgi:hypothetical protein
LSTTETRPGVQAPVESLAVSAFTVPTDEPGLAAVAGAAAASHRS